MGVGVNLASAEDLTKGGQMAQPTDGFMFMGSVDKFISGSGGTT